MTKKLKPYNGVCLTENTMRIFSPLPTCHVRDIDEPTLRLILKEEQEEQDAIVRFLPMPTSIFSKEMFAAIEETAEGLEMSPVEFVHAAILAKLAKHQPTPPLGAA
jgi:hypothetical protein